MAPLGATPQCSLHSHQLCHHDLDHTSSVTCGCVAIQQFSGRGRLMLCSTGKSFAFGQSGEADACKPAGVFAAGFLGWHILPSLPVRTTPKLLSARKYEGSGPQAAALRLSSSACFGAAGRERSITSACSGCIARKSCMCGAGVAGNVPSEQGRQCWFRWPQISNGRWILCRIN